MALVAVGRTPCVRHTVYFNRAGCRCVHCRMHRVWGPREIHICYGDVPSRRGRDSPPRFQWRSPRWLTLFPASIRSSPLFPGILDPSLSEDIEFLLRIFSSFLWNYFKNRELRIGDLAIVNVIRFSFVCCNCDLVFVIVIIGCLYIFVIKRLSCRKYMIL